jgi:drug/metabolite transporter (DMT)-like permease
LNQLLTTVFYGLAASLFWGSGDFSGGLASRRAKAASVVIGGYSVGFVLLVALAVIVREPFPRPGDFLWAGLAGISGVIGLVALYAALASGKMGLTAPIAGALTAALPVLFSAFTVGLPNPLQLGGFAVALVAIFLIARPERTGEDTGSARAVGQALLAGFGFGIFFILISRVSPATTFGSLAIARGSSVLFMAALQLVQRRPVRLSRGVAPLVLAAGGLDAVGNVFFLFAAHSGRLDVASVVSSLYPAATVLLAALILRERVRRVQGLGILLALVSIPLIAA